MFRYLGQIEVIKNEVGSFQNALDEIYCDALGYWNVTAQTACTELLTSDTFIDGYNIECRLSFITDMKVEDTLDIVGKRKIISSPIIYFSEKGCEKFVEKIPSFPPYLTTYIHVMNQFLIFSAQMFPIIIALRWIAYHFRMSYFMPGIILRNLFQTLLQNPSVPMKKIMTDFAIIATGVSIKEIYEANVLALDRYVLARLGFDVSSYPKVPENAVRVLKIGHRGLDAGLFVLVGDVFEGTSIEERLELLAMWPHTIAIANKDADQTLYLAQLEFVDMLKTTEVKKRPLNSFYPLTEEIKNESIIG